MSRSIFQPEWRTQSRRKRRFYARYMGWLEKTGYVVVTLLVAGFVASFFYSVDEWVAADDVPIEGETIAEIASPVDGWLEEVPANSGESVEKGRVLFVLRTQQEPLRVVADQGGTFVLAPGLAPGPVSQGQKLGTLRDYGRLVARPNLIGKSVANAAVGQRAEVSGIRVPSPDNTLLRLNLGDRTVVSRRLAGSAVRDALTTALVGKSVIAREDKPLTVAEIGDIEVEATLKAVPDGKVAMEPDPAADTVLTGTVREGKPMLSAQLGDLPPEAKAAATRALRDTLRAKGIEVGNHAYRVEDVLDPRIVVKLTANEAGSPADAVTVATIKRSFAALVDLDSTGVTPALRELVRTAEAQGTPVTARIQVRTGSRPVAYFLLRRS